MNYNKFFQLAKEAGIEEAELYISTSYALSVSTFHGEIDNYSVEDGSTYVARGIVNGKFGAATCDVYNAEKAKYLVEEILRNAQIIEKDDPAILFKGSEKYHKISTFNKELSSIPVEEKIAKNELSVLEVGFSLPNAEYGIYYNINNKSPKINNLIKIFTSEVKV